MMKKYLLFLLLSPALPASAQKIDLSLSAGTGKSYIVEDVDNNVNVNYSLPMSLMSELKYIPAGKNWGVKVRLHYIESTIGGANWADGGYLNGHISSTTASLLLEREVTHGKLSWGYNFGMGLTKETLQPHESEYFNLVRNYASINIGGLLSFKLSRDIDFQIQPVLLWQDPFDSIRFLAGSGKPHLAGEDLTAVVNFGVRYRFSGKLLEVLAGDTGSKIIR